MLSSLKKKRMMKKLIEALRGDDLKELGTLLSESNSELPDTLLLSARSRGAAELLVDAGLDPKYVDDQGYTLLHHCGFEEVMDFLIDVGVDPNQRTNDGCFAPIHGISSPGAIRALVRTGVNINTISGDGDTPLDWAMWHENDNQPQIETLRELGAKRANDLSEEERSLVYSQMTAQRKKQGHYDA